MKDKETARSLTVREKIEKAQNLQKELNIEGKKREVKDGKVLLDSKDQGDLDWYYDR